MGYAVTVDNGNMELDKDYEADLNKALGLYSRMLDNPDCHVVTVWEYDDEDGTRIRTIKHCDKHEQIASARTSYGDY